MLRVGFSVPFNELEAEPFASFVHATLTPIGRKRGWIDFFQPDIGPDGGFDSWGTNKETQQLVCVQCKRYSDPISVPELCHEIVKVAINSHLDRAPVSDHIVVTSGKVRDVLRRALRDKTRVEIKKRALRTLMADFANLRERAEDAGHDAKDIVSSYVSNVNFIVWSGQEFDTELGLVWLDIQDLLERHFRVQPVILEHPRPDFDEDRYRQLSASSYRRATPWCDAAELPNTVRNGSASDPITRSENSTKALTEPVELLKIVDSDTSGPLLLIIGEGGSGKSSALEIIRETYLDRRLDDGYDCPLPVLLQLGSVRGPFDESIHTSLGIHRGHWTSLPGQILLLLDGLDEVGSAETQLIQNAVRALSTDCRVAKIILTCRPSGPRLSFVAKFSLIVRILPLWARQILDIAADVLPETDDAERFLDAWLEASQEDEYLSRPQAVAALLAYWRDHDQLPKTHLELLASVTDVESRRATERTASLPPALQPVPQQTIKQLARWLIEATWLKEGSSTMNSEDYTTHINRFRLREDNRVLGLDTLGSLDIDQLLTHHGFIRKIGTVVSLPHDTICSFLAAEFLAKSWRSLIGSHSGRRFDRAWRAATPLVPPSEMDDFLRAWLATDVVMWAMLAIEAGRRSEAEAELLRRAKQPLWDYDVAELAAALALINTEACLTQLKLWAAETGDSGRPVIARRSLARIGDSDILRHILEFLDKADSSPARLGGEERNLWNSSPIGARLTLAREKVRTSGKANLGCSYRVVGQWGDKSDAALIRRALDSESVEMKAFMEAVVALINLSLSDAIEEIESALTTAPSDCRVHIIGLAKRAGLPIPTTQLLDEILASDQTDAPTEGRRFEALKLLGDIQLSEQDTRRIVENVYADDPVGKWAWSAIGALAIPEGLAMARELLGKPGGEPKLIGRTAHALSHNGVQGFADVAKTRFDELFPGQIDPDAARSLFDLCDLDGDHESCTEILGSVMNWFEKHMHEGATHLPFSFHRWTGALAKHRAVTERIGALRVLSWDMSMFRGIESLVENCFDMTDSEDLLQWLPGVSPDFWRHYLMHQHARSKSELRPVLARLLSVEIRDSPRPRLNKALAEAARICWCDELAQAVVETIVSFDTRDALFGGRMLDPGARADDLQRQLWDCFTVEQGINYVTPAVGIVANTDIQEVLEFLRRQTQRRR